MSLHPQDEFDAALGEIRRLTYRERAMKIGINWSENSTKRGAVWVVIFVVGLVMSWMGKDVSQLLLLGAGVAGGLGMALKNGND